MKTQRFPVLLSVPAGAFLLVLILGSCAIVPETGRRELLLVSAAEETQLGLTEFEKMKKSTPVCRDPAINATVQNVGKRIAAVAPLPNAQWEFVVFDDPKTVNAFCLPGGKVGVYTGILPITKDEGGLATVIGHEVSHAVARHGAERLSQGLLVQFGGELLGEAMRKHSETARSLALQAYGLGSTLGVVLPHSRRQETEADHIGLLYMARAGYDPQQAVDFWKRFAAYNAQQGRQTVQFLSTHPIDAVRIGQLEAGLPRAQDEFRRAVGR
jgi:predicted Zn-dependent protease